MEFFVTSTGAIYQGDCALGDRAATDAEVNARKTAMANAVPPEITDRQFFQAAALAGMITKDEAIAMMASGVIPAALNSAMSVLPADQQFAAKMKIIGARLFQRADPFLNVLGGAMGKSSADIDGLFKLGNTL